MSIMNMVRGYALALSVGVIASVHAENMGGYVVTYGNPTYPRGFYGADNGKNPGAEAFQKLLALLKKLSPSAPYDEDPSDPRPMMLLIYGKPSCSSSCDSFATMFTKNARLGTTALISPFVNGYFRGTDTASLEAKNFFATELGYSANCHMIGFYGIAGDGSVYKHAQLLDSATSLDGFKNLINAQKKKWAAFKNAHPYVPSASSAAFACGDAVGSRLEATPKTERIYVPFIRTNSLDTAEHNALRAYFPYDPGEEQQTVDIDLDWEVGQERAEVDFYMTGRYRTNKSIQLVLVGTNGLEVATNYIYCVGSKANTIDYPYYVGEKTEYAFGDWTLDYNLATGGVWAANSYKQADTGTVHRVEVAGSRQSFDWSTSNRYDTVYTNDLEFFASEERGKGHGPVGARKWAEDVTWTFNFAATNLVTTIFTNDVRFFDQMKVGEESMPTQHFEYVNVCTVVTNYVDGVTEKVGVDVGTTAKYFPSPATNISYRLIVEMPQGGLATNCFDSVLADAIVSYTETNSITFNCLTNDQHKASKGISVEYSITNTYNYADGTNVYYRSAADVDEVPFPQAWEFVTTNRVVTNYVDQVEEIGSPETNKYSVTFPYLVTNRMEFIVSPDKTATNLWGQAVTEQKSAQFNVTNLVYYALTNESYTTSCSITNDLEVLTNRVGCEGTNVYHTISTTTNVTFDVSFPTNYPPARTFAVNFDKSPAITNIVSSVPVEKKYKITATNYVTYVWSPSASSVTTNDADLVEKTFTEEDTDTYYDVTWDAEPKETLTPQSYCGTNKVHYVFGGSTVTNECAAEFWETKRETTQYATNYAHWVYRKESGIDTRYDDYRANQFTLALTNTYARVETNDYQYGYNDQVMDTDPTSDFYGRKGRSEITSVEACTLKVTGSPVWDAKTIAFKSVFDSAAFKDWCLSNNVATVLSETREEGTGASLFSHNLAKNKTSGSPFISSKGISVLDIEQPPVGEGLKIELFRPDGTLAGTFAPQMTQDAKGNWTCDVDENMRRLDELLKESDDKTEVANNDAETPLVFAWEAATESAQVGGQTLAVSDTEDWFRLTGDGWTKGKTVIEVSADADPAANLRLEVIVNGEVVEPAIEEIFLDPKMIFETNYTFSASDIAASNVFVRVVAYDSAEAKEKILGSTCFGYTLLARPIKESPGVVSFLKESTNIVCKAEDQVYRVGLTRVYGHKGDVTATVCLNELLTTATNMYEFVPQTVSWADGESGTNYIDIALKGTNACDGIKDITLTNSVSGANIDEKVYKYYDIFTISYGQEPTEWGPMGILWMRTTPSLSVDERIYVRYDSTADYLLFFDVYRLGGLGAATGMVTVTSGGKRVGSQTLVWNPYQTGNKMTYWNYKNLPAPSAKTGYADATIKLTTDVGIAEGCDKLNVRVLAKDAPAFKSETVTWGDAVQYVAFSNAVAVSFANEDGAFVESALPAEWTVLSAVKIDGDLPKGLSVSADKTTGALIVKGTPTAAGEDQTSIWWMKFKDAQGNVVMSSPVSITIKVTALAYDDDTQTGLIPGFDQARSWSGLPLVNGQTKRLAGILDMTVAKNGRTSARWRKAGGQVVSFSASSLSGAVQDESEGTNVYVTATKAQNKVENTFNVTFWDDGSIKGYVCEDDGTFANFTISSDEVWSKTHTAEAWAGNYTLAFPHDAEGVWHDKTLCFGPTTLRVKFTASSRFKTGKAPFAGTLPNGKSVSGTAAFVPVDDEDETATLPIFFSSTSDTLGALVDVPMVELGSAITPSKTATNFWSHIESKIAEASYDNDYYVIGTRFTNENWSISWPLDYGTNTLAFAVDGDDAGACVKANKTSLSVSDKGDIALAFQLNKTSGIAAGTFRADTTGTGRLSTVSWRGVALPGNDDFMLGAYSFSTNFWYNGGKSKRSVKAGGPVMLTTPLMP